MEYKITINGSRIDFDADFIQEHETYGGWLSDHMVNHFYCKGNYHARREGNVIIVQDMGCYGMETHFLVSYELSKDLCHLLGTAHSTEQFNTYMAVIKRTANAKADSIVRRINSRGL